MSFGLFEVITCRTCKESLPTHRFYWNKKSSKHVADCRTCYNKRTKDWQARNPEKMKSWKLRNPDYHKQWRAAHPGISSEYQKKYTRLGIKYRRKTPLSSEAKARHATSVRNGKVKKRAHRYRELYGSEFADAYTAMMQSTRPRGTGKAVIMEVRAAMLPEWLKSATYGTQLRVEWLNVISKQPYGARGWNCGQCQLHHDDYRFFDIDHIVPRHKKGNNSLQNKQILCPNCHRNKTIVDYTPSTGVTCLLPPSDNRGRVTALESCQDGEAAKVMRCEASNSAA